MKVLAFAASNSSTSINKQLVNYSKSLLEGGLVKNADVEVLDLNDYEMAIYSEDRQRDSGIPQLAHDFRAKITESEAIVISFPEHNGSYSAAFKNIYDWVSRIDMNVFQQKNMVVLSTSPGKGGAKNVLNTALTSFPYFGGDNIKGSLSVPEFYQVFDSEHGELTADSLVADLKGVLSALAD